MSLILLWQQRGTATPPEPPAPHEAAAADIGGGGGAGYNPWRARQDKLRKERAIEEEELIFMAQVAMQQIVSDALH